MQKQEQDLAVMREELAQQEYTERRHRRQLKHVQKGQIKLKKQLDYVIKEEFCKWSEETEMLKNENTELRREKDGMLKAKYQMQEENEKLHKESGQKNIRLLMIEKEKQNINIKSKIMNFSFFL